MRVPLAEDPDSVQNRAVGFYAVNGRAFGHGRPLTELAQTPTEDRPTTPRAPASRREQVRNPEAENVLIHPPRVVEVAPGPDTEALMAQNMAAYKESGEDSESLDLRKVKAEEHIYEDKSQGPVKESRATAQRTKENKVSDVTQDDDPDYHSEPSSEEEEGRNWSFSAIFEKVIKPLQTQQERDSRVIDKLRRINRKLKKQIEGQEQHIEGQEQKIAEQEDTIRVLEQHSNKLEEQYNNAQARIREASANATQLKNDIARLSNAIPELARDDQYFNTQFSGVFLSVESWVLQYFMASEMESSSTSSLPKKLKEGLVGLWGKNWKTFLFEDTLHAIEAVAIFIIQDLIFDTRVVGIVGNFFPAIERHFGSCTVDEVNAWRMNTTRMIIADKEFPARFEKRVCEVTEHIENLLGPLAPATSSLKKASARMRRLKAIVEQAARLALECSQEPSTFSFHTYIPGFECQPTCMTDADRTVDDENLGADGACVKFTVSPAVLRAPKCVSDGLILIMKARVVRHIVPPPEAENTRVEPGDASAIGITGTELDLAFGSGSS